MDSEFNVVPKCRNDIMMIANNVIFIGVTYFTGLGSPISKHISIRVNYPPEMAEALVDSFLVADARANPHNLEEATAFGQTLPPTRF